ncbi:MAG: hypothetical protein R2784_06570 [Saprospiraceae bacterium]
MNSINTSWKAPPAYYSTCNMEIPIKELTANSALPACKPESGYASWLGSLNANHRHQARVQYPGINTCKQRQIIVGTILIFDPSGRVLLWYRGATVWNPAGPV